MALVVLVCTGNTCRSPMAEGLFRGVFRDHSDIETVSAGTDANPGEGPAPEAVAAAGELGADIRQHRSQKIQPSLMAQADLVVTMTRRQAEQLRGRFPALQDKVAALGELAGGEDIPDPLGQPLPVYRRTAADIADQLAAARPEIMRRLGQSA